MKYLITISLLLIANSIQAQKVTSEIYEFMRADNVPKMEAFVKSGNDINQCLRLEKSTYTLLTLAIKSNATAIFQKCISLGADIEQICTDKTPLMYAIKNGRMEMMKVLLENGVDKNQKSNRGKTALDYAIKYKKSEMAKLLE